MLLKSFFRNCEKSLFSVVNIQEISYKILDEAIMGNRCIFTILFFLFFMLDNICAQWPISRTQNDWHLGPGLSDTTGRWGARYFTSSGINNAVSPIMLLADPASYVYTNWVSRNVTNAPEVGTFTWCVRPADINRDGYVDIIANMQDVGEFATGYICWFEGPPSGWIYSRHTIATYTAIDRVAGCFPVDIDHDGDIDVVAGTNMRLNWYENNGFGGGWAARTIYTTPFDEYRAWYYDVADADGDGWNDVLVTEVEIDYGILIDDVYAYTTIYWGNIAGPTYFSGYTVLSSFTASDGQFWRAVFFDADPADGFLDVAYERCVYGTGTTFQVDSLIVATQGPARTFTRRYSHVVNSASNNMGHDGLWANDFDGDGDQDLVVATADNDCATLLGCNNSGYFFLVQSDPGDVFSYHQLFLDPLSTYGDGAIMHDMDGDGSTDVVGTCDSLGYYRRTGPGYTDFTLYRIDNIPGTGFATHFASHWVFPFNLDRGICSGDADVDLIVVFDNASVEEIRVYENRMFSYMASGNLYSAILGIPLPTDTCVVCSLFWEGCQIPEYTITLSGRCGSTKTACQAAGYGTPSTSPYHTSPRGWYMGDMRIPTDTAWVQYRIEINRTGAPVDLSPLVDSVWVKVYPIRCECELIRAMWTCPECFSFTACSAQVAQMVLWTDSTRIDTNRVYFTVNNGFVTFPLCEPSPNLSFVCLTPNCDSVFAQISGYIWLDAATITIDLDSGFTIDGCGTVW